MYGKWVRLDLGDGIACSVWVPCTPETPEEELKQTAMFRLAWKMRELERPATIVTSGNTEEQR